MDSARQVSGLAAFLVWFIYPRVYGNEEVNDLSPCDSCFSLPGLNNKSTGSFHQVNKMTIYKPWCFELSLSRISIYAR